MKVVGQAQEKFEFTHAQKVPGRSCVLGLTVHVDCTTKLTSADSNGTACLGCEKLCGYELSECRQR